MTKARVLTRKEVRELVYNHIDRAFGTAARVEMLKSGDLDPLSSLELDKMIDRITDIIYDTYIPGNK